MRKASIRTLLIFILGMTLSMPLSAEEDLNHHSLKKGKSSLHISENIRNILSEEMIALQGGMVQLVPAIASGNWGFIAETASKMEASYIMNQKLTKKEIAELHRTLPHEFQRLDQEFHEMSGKLSKAAGQQDGQLVPFYFYKLVESCIACQSLYATHKFPQLSPQEGHDHHH